MPINDQEKVHYLANVLLVAFADKSLSPRETAALEEVRKSIDAKKGVLAAAQKAIEGGSFPFSKAGSFADQVKNLEDMLFVALTDKDLSERESHLMSEFGRLIGVSQGQMDQLVAETSRRCDSAKHDITCPSCSQLASAQARFCPSCGQSLTSPDAVAFQVGFDIPKAGYAIEFSESTAAGFATALELAKATRTAYSDPSRPLIPTQVSHPFRRNAATDSEVNPATHSSSFGIGGRHPSESGVGCFPSGPSF